jgi:hypothetical protein
MGNKCIRPRSERLEEEDNGGIRGQGVQDLGAHLRDRCDELFADSDWETSQFYLASCLNAQENSSARTLNAELDEEMSARRTSRCASSLDNSLRGVRFAGEFIVLPVEKNSKGASSMPPGDVEISAL